MVARLWNFQSSHLSFHNLRCSSRCAALRFKQVWTGGITFTFSLSGRFYPKQFRSEDTIQGFSSFQNLKGEVHPETHYVYTDIFLLCLDIMVLICWSVLYFHYSDEKLVVVLC